MSIELGLLKAEVETGTNTGYAPLAALLACYQREKRFSPLQMPSKGALMARYDQRGGAEIEQFRNDKNGLHLAARRKRKLHARKGLILLTDIVHNLLADLHHRAFVDTSLTGFGPKRIVRDLLTMLGKLSFEAGQLKRIDLLASHPHAKSMLKCLKSYTSGE